MTTDMGTTRPRTRMNAYKLQNYRTALGVALACHDDDWPRIYEMLSGLTKRQLREVAGFLAVVLSRRRDATRRSGGRSAPLSGCRMRASRTVFADA